VLVALMLGVTGVLLFANVRAGYHYLVSTRETRQTIEKLEAERRREETTRDAIGQQIARVDMERLGIASRYVNAQLAERAFSWSGLLDRLERVVPNGVRLTTLNPAVDKNGNIVLSMSCVAKNGDGMVDMLNRMIRDPHFDHPFPSSERTREDGMREFTIQADYTPAPVATEVAR
jgi:Tfp pilus assembly protein PilN